MPAKATHRKSRHPSKIKLLPTVRSVPPPPKARPAPKPDVRRSSGKDCPANAEIGRPERIRATKGQKGYCDRCQRRRGDEATRDLEARRAGGAPRTATA